MKNVLKDINKSGGKPKKRHPQSNYEDSGSDSENKNAKAPAPTAAAVPTKMTRSELGFEVAARELNLSEELLAQVPTDVRDWKATHSQLWLQEVFQGAETMHE